VKIEESIVILIKIVNNKSLTGFNKTPKGTYQLPNNKSSIIARVNLKLHSLGTASTRLFFAIARRLSQSKLSFKKSRVDSYHESSSAEQSRIEMNMFRGVQSNWFSISTKLIIRIGKIAKREWLSSRRRYIREYLEL
jgi:hypothetical protein